MGARFADNDDTRLGCQVHRRVDTETGAAPPPEDSELRALRSVTLSSDRLGVIARLDLVEGAGGAVVPVDYKKGVPHRSDAGQHPLARHPSTKRHPTTPTRQPPLAQHRILAGHRAQKSQALTPATKAGLH